MMMVNVAKTAACTDDQIGVEQHLTPYNPPQ